MNDELPSNLRPKPFWKRAISFILFAGLIGGLYYAYTTGELLNILNELLSQDPLLLIIVAVIGLIGIALIMGG